MPPQTHANVVTHSALGKMKAVRILLIAGLSVATVNILGQAIYKLKTGLTSFF